uniref:Uncharacterized protein n=1 Tax=Ditylenchus dipsaci TaxID=166011 RepID=A0A915E652_9BILA
MKGGFGKKNKKEKKETTEDKSSSSKRDLKKAKKHDKKTKDGKKSQDADKDNRAHRRVKHKAPEGYKEPEIVEHPLNEFRDDLKKKNKGHTHDELDDREEYNLFGDNLPLIEEKFEQEVHESRMKKIFYKGEVIKSDAHSYKIVKKLSIGPNVYKVQQNNKEFLVKFEGSETLVRASRLGREVRLLKNARKTEKHFRQHFLKMVDRGRIDKKYNFIVTQLAGPSLIDIKAKPYKLSMTFIFVNTFTETFSRKILLLGERNRRRLHQENDEHCGQIFVDEQEIPIAIFPYGYEYNRLSDMESWLYLCYWFFDAKCLPWEDASFADDDTSERQVCNFKELFLIGTYDAEMCEKSDRYLPTPLRTMRNKIYFEWLSVTQGPINYPFFAQAIIEMTNEVNIESWSEPYQWQLSNEDQRPVESFIKHGNHSGGGLCIACENSPLAKRTADVASKSIEPKAKEHKKKKKPKPVEKDSESGSSSHSKEKAEKMSTDTLEDD